MASAATQQVREQIRELAEAFDYREARVQLALTLTSIIRRLDELEARQ